MQSAEYPDTIRSNGHDTPLDKALPAITAVQEAVSRLRYGTVQLTIHDGRVVQLDVTERQRFT